MASPAIKITECPRDAMQGIHQFISTERKIDYINALLKVGYDTIDFGSFVSPKIIPQLRDTAEVYRALHLDATSSKLLAIVANERGARDACEMEHIHFLGFPFSISETFQLRNTNSTMAESLKRVALINAMCKAAGKELLIYISMGFGNPYGEPWNATIVRDWVTQISGLGIRTIALSDTIGVSNPENISYLFSSLVPAFEHIEFGAHLHTHAHNWEEKIAAAYESGCRRFDGAIKGFGGCPMADDVLVGNMPTEHLVSYFRKRAIDTGVEESAFAAAMLKSLDVFPVD
jgi:hydroxymethylglutaryl-CoA lyase